MENEFRAEQSYLHLLYQIVDSDHARTLHELERLLAESHSTPQHRLEREVLVRQAQARLDRLNAMSEHLCFGKVVTGTGSRMYVGRLALLDEQGESVLVDWRAPAAETFYRATASEPMGLALRRHFVTARRTLLQLDDEVLDLDGLGGADVSDHLVGSGALVAALGRRRSGRMGDIVATIQRQQDEIIRADVDQVLVVAGGPGTGKTVVALHRAAYLLYTHRQRIAEDGVLVVGPSRLFLRYVEQVLPALGESAAVMVDWSSLLPGLTAAEDDDIAEVRRLKGSARMVGLMRRCVRLFERAPKNGVDLRHIDGRLRHVRYDDLVEVRRSTRGSRRPHNLARHVYERALARQIGMDEWVPNPDGNPRAELNQRAVRSAAEQLWPVLSAEDVLRIVFGNRRLLDSIVRDEFSDDEVAMLIREPDGPWSISDIALLDELRALLGEGPLTHRVDDQGEAWKEEVRTARETFAGGGERDLGLSGMMSPESVAARFASVKSPLTVAERAAGDPSWRYAHIIVDEAQDVSHMQWRALMRRTRRSSMTVVGDLDQATVADAAGWESRLGAVLADADVNVRRLSVNYRTPRELMYPASNLLEQFGTQTDRGTEYVRTGDVPRLVCANPVEAAEIAPAISEALLALGESGRVAVVTPVSCRAEACEAVRSVVGVTQLADGVQRLDQRVAVFEAHEVKGLEFDSVVVIDPDGILAADGWRLLFVALTRATEHLTILATGESSALVRSWLDAGAVVAVS